MKKIFWNEYVSIGAMVVSISALILSMVVPGVQGPPGSNGFDGSNGNNGSNGTNGSDGINGSNGMDGLPGLDGQGIEFSIIDGVIMYRVGDGPWQRYRMENPYNDLMSNLDLPTIPPEEFNELTTFNGLETRDFHVVFGPITDQTAYIQDKLDNGFVPISSVADFLAINDDLEEDYVLTSNLDFSGVIYTQPLIGTSQSTYDGLFEAENRFYGTLDGAGFTLSNLTFEGSAHIGGIFASLSGAVGNLTIANAVMEIDTPLTGDPLGYGFLAGFASSGLFVENVNIINSTMNQSMNAGLLIGTILEDSESFFPIPSPSLIHKTTITDSQIIAPNEDGINLGGVVGYVGDQSVYFSSITMTRVNLGNVSNFAGQLIGRSIESELSMFNNRIIDGSIFSLSNESEALGGFIGGAYNSSLFTMNNHIQNLDIESEYGAGMAGFIGLIEENSFIQIIQTVVRGLTIHGAYHVGGLLGETRMFDELSESTPIISLAGNDVESELTGQEFAGGLVGSYRGTLFMVHNILSTTIKEIRFGAGGFIGAINEQSYVYMFYNVSEFNFLRNYTLFNGTFDINTGYIGGLVGVVEDFAFIQAETNFLMNTIDNRYRIGGFGNPIEATTTIRAIGGLFGLTKQGDFLINNLSVTTEFLYRLQYDHGNETTTHSLSFNDVGGMVGSATNSSFYVFHSFFETEVAIRFHLIDTAPDDISASFRYTGGLVGSMEEGSLALKHVHVDVLYNLFFEQVNENEPWNRLFIAIDAMGGAIGIATDSSIEMTLFSIEFNLNVLQGDAYHGFSSGEYLILRIEDTGGMVGVIQGSIFAQIDRAWLQSSLHIDRSLFEVALATSPSAIEIHSIGGIIGVFESVYDSFSVIDMSNVLVSAQFLKDVDLPLTDFFMDFYAGFGDNFTPFFRILGQNILIYSTSENVYGGGLYPFNFVEVLPDEVSLLAAFETWLSSPYWMINNNTLTLYFFSPIHA